MDVTNAFLQALMKVTYVKQPKSHVIPGTKELVYLLHKSLYGFKPAGRSWFDTIDDHLLAYGFRPSDADPCVYVKTDGADLCG